MYKLEEETRTLIVHRAKILSFVLRQFSDDFKEEDTVFLLAWPIRGGGGVLGAVSNKNCVVRDERGWGIGVSYPFC